jgi:protein-disulfide isomerase
MTNARQARSAREKSAAMQADAAKAANRNRAIAVAVAVVAALGVVIGATVLIRTAQDDAATGAAVAEPANMTDDAFIVGEAQAPVTLRVYSDFACPVCKQFEQANSAQIDAWVKDGTARVEYKPISILDKVSPDQYSTRSASAAAVVADQSPDAWVGFHDALFQNQPTEGDPGLTDDKLVELAVAAGADEAKVRPGIEAKKFAGYVTRATENAGTGPDKVRGTPAVFVNGDQVKDWSPEKLKAQVEAAAKK